MFYRLTMMHALSGLFPQACVAEYTVRGNELPDFDFVTVQVVLGLLR